MTQWAQLSANLDDLQASGRWPSGPATTLEIIGQTKVEAAHEKLIAWLLTPLANHGLGPMILAGFLTRLDHGQLPSPDQLADARVRTQVVGAWGRPDIEVTVPGRRLVIELKIDAPESFDQTGRQARGYAGVPNVSFIFLTLGGSPPSDPRFEHVLLSDFYKMLRQALSSSNPPTLPAHVRGRAVAADYAATLERMLGLNSPDQEAARYWFRYESEIRQAETEASRLLEHLPENTRRAFEDVAAQLGDDVQVADFEYAAPSAAYQERAVLMTRKSWMLDAGTAALGVGLGISVRPKAGWGSGGAYRPFWGIYAEGEQRRESLRDRLAQIPDLPDRGGRQWDPWARWWYVDLQPPIGRDDLLVYYADMIAKQVGQFWRSYHGMLAQPEG